MSTFLVIFKSHADGLADEHFVRATAENALSAIAEALREKPPIGPWAVARALPWPRGCRTIDQAVLRATGTDG